MYARTIVLELVKREENVATGEHDAAKRGHAAKREYAAAKRELAGPPRDGDVSAPENEAESPVPDQQSDLADTRMVADTLSCEGTVFDWWVLGEKPTFVTIRNPMLGKLSGFTEADPEAFAKGLAKQLLDRHARSEATQASPYIAAVSPLEKPGWFEK